MKTKKTTALAALVACIFLSFQVLGEEVEGYEITQGELDQLLAPIALYPDTILSHILIASTYPLEVIQAERWISSNPDLEGEEALDAAEKKDWDASVKALVPFPQILQKMSEDLEWMQKLGDAFLQNEELVLASIQELRQRAYEEGNLDELEHMKVSHDDDHIVIEPASREVVYVPYYDTRVVYGSWGWVDHPPIYWHHRRYHYAGSHFYWGPSIHVGLGFHFSGVHWRNSHIVVVDRHYARSHRFHSGRHVVRHSNSRQWVHNTRHRRGVEYRHPRMRHNNRAQVGHSRHNVEMVRQRLNHNSSRSHVYDANGNRQERAAVVRSSDQRANSRAQRANNRDSKWENARSRTSSRKEHTNIQQRNAERSSKKHSDSLARSNSSTSSRQLHSNNRSPRKEYSSPQRTVKRTSRQSGEAITRKESPTAAVRSERKQVYQRAQPSESSKDYRSSSTKRERSGRASSQRSSRSVKSSSRHERSRRK